MTVVETVLVFAGIPLGIVLVVALLTVAPSAVRSGGGRYRPGRPWEYQTAWWLPEPEAVGPRSHAVQAEHRSAVAAIESRAADEAGRHGASDAEAREAGRQEADRRVRAAVGGASGEW